MTVEIGQVIDGKYRIVRLIGQGGMGAVYEGLNQLIDRRVAIKVMLPDIGSAAVGRFEQEARAAGRIGNDHILEILDMGRLGDGSHYMVMEYLDGESLESRLDKRGALTPGELAPIALQLLTALGAAHRAGVLHRDLKPDNVFLVREKAGHRDFVKLIDFGISKFAQDSSLNLTKTGTMVGTPYYMSPEQARGKGPVDARADLYAVGVILYQCVSGQLPFEAETFNDLLFKIVLEPAPPVLAYAPQLDPRFAAIVEKAMARDANARYQTAEELSDAIVTWLRESGEGQKLPSFAPSYRQPMSRAATPSPRAETPLPMATLAVSSTGDLPVSYGAPGGAASGGAVSSGPLGRGATPRTPNTFGRTAAEALERPVPPTSGIKGPALWGAIAFAVAAIALGAFLLMPSAEPSASAAAPTASSPVAPPPSQPLHGEQFRPETVQAEATTAAAPASSATAAPDEPKAEEPKDTEPAVTKTAARPAGSTAKSTSSKAAPAKSTPAKSTPATPAKTEPSAPAKTEPTTGGKFYFGY